MCRHWILGALVMLACGEQVVVRDQVAKCGNSIIDAAEQCDDGNREPGDACTDGCLAAICGDGILRVDLELGGDGYEACDDGNDSPTDGCLNTCTIAVCGDGVVITAAAQIVQMCQMVIMKLITAAHVIMTCPMIVIWIVVAFGVVI